MDLATLEAGMLLMGLEKVDLRLLTDVAPMPNMWVFPGAADDTAMGLVIADDTGAFIRGRKITDAHEALTYIESLLSQSGG